MGADSVFALDILPKTQLGCGSGGLDEAQLITHITLGAPQTGPFFVMELSMTTK